jgi:hypothetical protein
VLSNNGLVGSMGRVGAPAGTAAMESFFALLQKNVLNRQQWRTREELRLAIVTWIEKTHHRRRRQRALGKLTPIEFERWTSMAARSPAPPAPITSNWCDSYLLMRSVVPLGFSRAAESAVRRSSA